LVPDIHNNQNRVCSIWRALETGTYLIIITVHIILFLTLLGDPVTGVSSGLDVGILLLVCMLGTEESYTDGLEVGILLLGSRLGTSED